MEEIERALNIIINKVVLYGAPEPDTAVLDYDDYDQMASDLTAIKARMAELEQAVKVRDRALEIWRDYGDACPPDGVCEKHANSGCANCLHDYALAQATEEMEKEKP